MPSPNPRTLEGAKSKELDDKWLAARFEEFMNETTRQEKFGTGVHGNNPPPVSSIRPNEVYNSEASILGVNDKNVLKRADEIIKRMRK